MAAGALVTGAEAAWRPAFAASAIEWLAAQEYAVLGTELLLPEADCIQSLPYFQTSDPKSDEPWASFLSRAAAETLAYLRAPDGKFANESGIIRAFDSMTTSADGNEQIVPAIEDTIESLRYAIPEAIRTGSTTED